MQVGGWVVLFENFILVRVLVFRNGSWDVNYFCQCLFKCIFSVIFQLIWIDNFVLNLGMVVKGIRRKVFGM